MIRYLDMTCHTEGCVSDQVARTVPYDDDYPAPTLGTCGDCGQVTDDLKASAGKGST